tara:strand:+ start:3311 stop:6070 length:2760 start_codon:yes stop_codon:yes gene_type:complete
MADLQVSITESSSTTITKLKSTSKGRSISIIPTGVAGPKGEKGDTTSLSDTDRALIDANTAKTGITIAQTSKLSGIAFEAEVNVQSDFNETNLGSKSFIKNKPNILQLGTSSTTALAGNTTTITSSQSSAIISNTAKTGITTSQSNAITANTAKVSFPGLGTTSTTALAGNTALLQLGTSSSTALAGNTVIPTVPTLIDSDSMSGASATNIASAESIKAYVDNEITTLGGSAPAALNTLNELAAALNDDASFSTTVTNSIALKATINNPTFTGTIAIPNIANIETAIAANTLKNTNATHTGDVTGSGALTIGNDKVTYAKMQNVTNARMLGNNAGSDGDVTEMTKANVLTFLNVADGATADQTNVTGSSGSCTGNAATATSAGVVTTAAQPNITSLGTLTALQVDQINVNASTISGSSNTTITSAGQLALTAGTGGSGSVLGITSDSVAVIGDDFEMLSATSSKPLFNLKSTTNDNKGSTIQFTSDKGGVGADDDIIGTIDFIGDNVGQTQTLFGKIQTRVETAANGDEAGKMRFMVSKSDSTTAANTTGLELIGHGTNSTISASIGHGAASLTTIAGDLKVTGNEIQDSGGNVVVSSNGSGVGQFTGSLSGNAGTVTSIGNLTGDVTSSNRATTIANDAVTYAKMQDVSATNVVLGRDSAGAGVVEEISAANLRTIINVENGATADQSKSDIDGLAITTVGTLDTGNATAVVTDASTSAKGKASFSSDNFAVSSGAVTIKDGGVDLTAEVTGVLPSANLDADTAHLTTDQTFTGQKQINIRKFPVSSGTDGNAIGDVAYFGGTTSMTVGRIYHYKSDGTWELANADAIATSDGLLAVALGAASDTNGMLLRGMVTLDHDPGAVGDVLYVQSDNAGTTGHATATAPSATGDCVRIVGYCVHASAGNIWFNPDNTFVEHA